MGRFVIVRDLDGRRHALSATAVSAVCEDDGGCLLMLPGGRLVRLDATLDTVLGWLT